MGRIDRDRKKKASMSTSALKKERKAIKKKRQGHLQIKRQGLPIYPIQVKPAKDAQTAVPSK